MTWKAWLVDTIERAGFTFVQTFLALVTVAGGTDWLNISTVKAAGVGALAAALAIVKAAIASRTSDTVSPASLAPISATES